MIPNERARGMKPPSYPKPLEPTKILTDLLHRRTRAVKDASDSVLNIDSRSFKSGAGDARRSSLVRRADQASDDHSMNGEENEGEEVYDTLIGRQTRRLNSRLMSTHSLNRKLRVRLRIMKLFPYPLAP